MNRLQHIGMISLSGLLLVASSGLLLAACTASATDSTAADESDDENVSEAPAADTPCSLTNNTTATSTCNSNSCCVLNRNTTGCSSARDAAGIPSSSTYQGKIFRQFSCRVTLSMSGGNVVAQADSQPDHTSAYFSSTDGCYSPCLACSLNPNTISANTYSLTFPSAPSGSATSMTGHGVVGMSVGGVPIYANFAAPGDCIFQEITHTDQCLGHPENSGQYHYHVEPQAITNDDSRLVGVMRDGFPLYGRRDPNGTIPTNLDAYGGHVGPTPDSATNVYHYHINQQQCASHASDNCGAWCTVHSTQTAWFNTTGTWKAAPGSCTGSGC